MLFELDEGGMRKFYRIEREGTRVVLEWGRLGAKGQRKVLELPDEAAAKAEYDSQVLRRYGRGYLKVHNESAPCDQAIAKAEAETARLSASVPLSKSPRFMFVHPRTRRFVWLEQRGDQLWSASGEVGSEATAHPEVRTLTSAAAAARAQESRVRALLADGFALDAFDAKRSRVKPAKPSAKPKRAAPRSPATPTPDKPLTGRRFAFFGEFAIWPAYHGVPPIGVARQLGADATEELADLDDVDVVVFGDLRGPNRSQAKKRVERKSGVEVMDEASFRELVRIDLRGKRFAFAGGFDCSPEGLDDGLLTRMVEATGATVSAEIDETLDYLAIGNRRGPSKIARVNQATRLIEAGARITKLDEDAFLDLVRIEQPAGTTGKLDFSGFIGQLYGYVDRGKLGRALVRLRKDRFKLYAQLEPEHLVGVVRSQSGSGNVYASWLAHDGRYGCSQPDLNECMGLQGSMCKHLLVLVVGLSRTGELPMAQALAWVRGAQRKPPRKNDELCASTFIRYKGAEAGQVDWRPTETIPEDFYAL
ncbi:MAG: WGR domain-containing protein [Kofleriaceae bacterium]